MFGCFILSLHYPIINNKVTMDDQILDDYEYDSLMDEIEDLTLNEEIEDLYYDISVDEINVYWDLENEYIKNSGIYTKEEVEQILENHNQIRNEKLAEAKKNYEEAKGWIREQKQLAAEDMQFNRDVRELNKRIARLGAVNNSVAVQNNDMAYRAYREEQAAYDDFIASLDMADSD